MPDAAVGVGVLRACSGTSATLPGANKHEASVPSCDGRARGSWWIVRSCVFCGIELTKSNRSKEHIVPEWLQKARGLSDQTLSAGFGTASSLTIKRQMDLDSFLAGKVCENCNNGWMHDLEEATRSLLIRLLDRDANPETLGEEERQQLTKWAIKTAISCNSALSDEPQIDGGFIRDFDRGRGNNLGKCGVFGGRLDLQNRFGYVQTTADNPMSLSPQPAEIRVGLCIEGLVLLIVVVDKGLGLHI